MFGAALALCVLASLAFALVTALFKRFRFWSSNNFLFYYLELSVGLASAAFVHMLVIGLFHKLGLHFAVLFDFVHAPFLFFWATVFVVLVFATIHYSEREVLNQLRRADILNLKVQNDRREIMLTEEELRKQTSRFLHDRVQSQITIAAMNLALVQSGVSAEASAEIAKIRAHLEKIRRFDLKMVSQVLSPNIEGIGLSNSVLQFTEQSESKIIFALELDDSLLAQRPQLALGVFRIIEQAIINAITHGPAKNVQVRLAQSGKKSVEVKVVDDGPGAELSESVAGVGTAVIDSWVSILGGTKVVKTASSNGYELTVLLPAQTNSSI
jgi:signal transduction histidine kinase